MKGYIGEGQKKETLKQKNTNQNKNPPFGYSPIPLSEKLGCRLFSRTRKQAWRPLCGRELWVKVNLPRMGSQRTWSATVMSRKGREGWVQHCPLSYDQACCMHPPSVKCYAAQAFSFKSDVDPKLMPKEKNQIAKRKVCTVIQSFLLHLPNPHSGHS